MKLLVDPDALLRAAAHGRDDAGGDRGDAGSGAGYLLQRRREREDRAAAEQLAAELADDVHARLQDCADDAVLTAPQNRELSGHDGDMLLNGAYLVERGRVRACATSSPSSASSIATSARASSFTGPFPPYNFAAASAGRDRDHARPARGRARRPRRPPARRRRRDRRRHHALGRRRRPRARRACARSSARWRAPSASFRSRPRRDRPARDHRRRRAARPRRCALVRAAGPRRRCARPQRPSRPTPTTLWRHEAIVERLMADRALLPVRFGTRLSDEDEVGRRARRAPRRVRAPRWSTCAARSSWPCAFSRRAPRASLDAEHAVHRAAARARARHGDPARRRPAAAPPTSSTAARSASSSRAVRRLQERNPGLAILCTGPWPPYSFANGPRP